MARDSNLQSGSTIVNNLDDYLEFLKKIFHNKNNSSVAHLSSFLRLGLEAKLMKNTLIVEPFFNYFQTDKDKSRLSEFIDVVYKSLDSLSDSSKRCSKPSIYVSLLSILSHTNDKDLAKKLLDIVPDEDIFKIINKQVGKDLLLIKFAHYDKREICSEVFRSVGKSLARLENEGVNKEFEIPVITKKYTYKNGYKKYQNTDQSDVISINPSELKGNLGKYRSNETNENESSLEENKTLYTATGLERLTINSYMLELSRLKTENCNNEVDDKKPTAQRVKFSDIVRVRQMRNL